MAREPQEVLRQKGQVNTSKQGSEMYRTPSFRGQVPRKFRGSKIKCGKQPKHRPHREDIVKVGHNIVGVVQSRIETCVGEDHPGDTPYCEEKYEAQSKEYSYTKGECPGGCCS